MTEAGEINVLVTGNDKAMERPFTSTKLMSLMTKCSILRRILHWCHMKKRSRLLPSHRSAFRQAGRPSCVICCEGVIFIIFGWTAIYLAITKGSRLLQNGISRISCRKVRIRLPWKYTCWVPVPSECQDMWRLKWHWTGCISLALPNSIFQLIIK